jgi:hypothetical protein
MTRATRTKLTRRYDYLTACCLTLRDEIVRADEATLAGQMIARAAIASFQLLNAERIDLMDKLGLIPADEGDATMTTRFYAIEITDATTGAVQDRYLTDAAGKPFRDPAAAHREVTRMGPSLRPGDPTPARIVFAPMAWLLNLGLIPTGAA